MPASPGTDSGTAITPAPVAGLSRGVDAWARPAVVPPLFAVLTAAAQSDEEHAARTVAPVEQSYGNPVADSSSAEASWNVEKNLGPEPSTRCRRSHPDR